MLSSDDAILLEDRPTEALSRQAAIARSAVGFSIESMPRDASRIADFRDHLPVGTQVYIAWPPKADLNEMVEAAAKLRREGMTPIPHVAARRVESKAILWDFIRRLSEEADVTRLLLLGGDPDAPMGPYPDASSLLASGVLQAFGIKAVDIAGHPEGHPVMQGETPLEVLREKIALARQAGVEVRVVSQFVLDPSAVAEWYDNDYRRVAGDTVLQIGIPGVVSTRRLLQLASSCGLSGSLGMLKKSGRRLAKTAMSNDTTEVLVTHLAHRVNTEENISGFHFYSFGNFEKTAAWACAVSRGEFDLKGNTIQLN